MIGLVYIHREVYVMTDEKEQQIAWQTLKNTLEKADFFFDKHEMAAVEIADFASSLENDTTILYQVLTQLLQNNHDLRATFICFYDSTRQQNLYLIQDKNNLKRASFNDYITEMKQKSLQKHFENSVQPFWEDQAVSITTENQAHINFFVPFSDKSDRMKGFVGFNMSLAWVDTLLQSALTYYNNDPCAFMFMLTADKKAVSIAGDMTRKNRDPIKATENDDRFVSMIYNMRNGEAGSAKLYNDYTGTSNMFFYKSLTNKRISIALSYYENQSMDAWNRLFLMIMGAQLFSFGCITLWLWWYWKRRLKMVDQIGKSLDEIGEKGSTTDVLPSSSHHGDLENLCAKIESMQRGLDRRDKRISSQERTDESIRREKELAQFIRKYFYSPAFQSYDTSLSQKIRQCIKMDYLSDVGGDFHDYFNITPQLICFVTGTVSRPKKDVSNIQTAIDILMTMNLIRSHLKAYSSLNQAIFHLNNDLYSQNNSNFKVKLFMGVLNCETGILEFVSAGASTYYMISHRNIFASHVEDGSPLATIPNEEYSIGKRELFSGDMLMTHTAGLLSRQNTASENYGQPRLQQAMASASSMNPDMFLEKVTENITDFTKYQSMQMDDYTMLVIKYEEGT